MPEVDPRGVLYNYVDKYPTQAAAAKALGITPAYLSDLVNGRRDLSDKMLTKLGLRRTVVPK